MPHALQVITVDLAYCSAAEPLITHTPGEGADISRLLAFLCNTAPGLTALKVTAMRRDVTVDIRRMPSEHLTLACKQLTLRGGQPHQPPSAASLHFLFETAPRETASPASQPAIHVQ